MNQETSIVGDGHAVIQFPTEMAAEGFEDFTDWLEILHRKVARTIEGNHKPKLKREDSAKT